MFFFKFFLRKSCRKVDCRLTEKHWSIAQFAFLPLTVHTRINCRRWTACVCVCVCVCSGPTKLLSSSTIFSVRSTWHYEIWMSLWSKSVAVQSEIYVLCKLSVDIDRFTNKLFSYREYLHPCLMAFLSSLPVRDDTDDSLSILPSYRNRHGRLCCYWVVRGRCSQQVDIEI